MNFRYKIIQFMRGRYGVDGLFYVLFAAAATVAILNCFVGSIWLQLVVDVILVYAFFRVMSRNVSARRKENRLFYNIALQYIKWRNIRRQRKADCSHVYKKCPRCRAILRLPRKKGKHTTVCPKCQKEFKVYVFKA